MLIKNIFRRCSESIGKTTAHSWSNDVMQRATGGAFVISATALLLLIPASGHAYSMAWETNKFDSDLGNWSLELNSTANGNDVQWRNSNGAGGTAGEIGGRTADFVQSAYIGRYLDNTINLNDPMHFRGTVMSINTDNFLLGQSGQDLNVWVGYFNTADQANRMGWRFSTPSSAGATNPLRGRARINGGGQGSQTPMNQGQSYSFEANWVPSGLNDGSGTFSGNIAGTPWNIAYGAGTGTYDAFGLFWSESSATAGLSYYVYFDNMEYLVPVPEPATGLLAGLGIVGLWLGNRVRRGRRN